MSGSSRECSSVLEHEGGGMGGVKRLKDSRKLRLSQSS